MAARSPLRFLTPKNHGDGAWVYAASFGGGLLDGDALALELDVGAGALGLMTTQASTKVYRTAARRGQGGARQDLVAQVARGGALALVPDPVVCFAGARYRQTTRVDLAPQASLVLVDALVAGRTARGERWAFDAYGAWNTVHHEGQPLLADGLVLDPAAGDLGRRFGRFDALATVVVVGPRFAQVREGALSLPPRAGVGHDVALRATPLQAGGEVIGALLRVAATTVGKMSGVLRDVFVSLPDALGDDPFARKW